MEDTQNTLTRKAARVFQPTVLFHSENRDEVTPRDNNPTGQQDLWPYISLRNYVSFPWLQLQTVGNSCFTSKSNGICPLGCSVSTCPDQKHLTSERRIEPRQNSTEQSDSINQVLNLLPLVKSTREAQYPDAATSNSLENQQSRINETKRPDDGGIKQGPVQKSETNNGSGIGQPVCSEEKNKTRTNNGKKKLHCPFCNVSCSNHGQLRGHLRCHTGEKPFICTYDGCTRQFARNEELTRHKRIHTGLRPFICSSCKKTFGRKDHLQKHAKTHLEPGQKKTFVCPVCHQGYSRSDALTRHKVTAHSNQNKNADNSPTDK